MPSYWYKSYEQILIGLCRLDKVTQYLRIPPELWSLGWSPMVMDLENLAFASIPIDYLHDKDILEVYVKRLLTLGKITLNYSYTCLYPIKFLFSGTRNEVLKQWFLNHG